MLGKILQKQPRGCIYDSHVQKRRMTFILWSARQLTAIGLGLYPRPRVRDAEPEQILQRSQRRPPLRAAFSAAVGRHARFRSCLAISLWQHRGRRCCPPQQYLRQSLASAERNSSWPFSRPLQECNAHADRLSGFRAWRRFVSRRQCPSTFTLSTTTSPASGSNVLCSIGLNRRTPELFFFYRRFYCQQSASLGSLNMRKSPFFVSAEVASAPSPFRRADS